MAILRPLRCATPPAARLAPSRAALALLLVGAALCAPACGGKDGANVGALCPASPQRATESPAMAATDFCQLFLQTCNGTNNPPGGYTTEADCERAYLGLTYETTRECRSYHVCNSAAYDTQNVLLHCRHAVGLDMCTDTPAGP